MSNTFKGDIEELLPKMDAFCFTQQHVDCLCILFNYRFSDKSVAKSENVFDVVQRAVYCSRRTKGVHRKPSISKKIPLRKKFGKDSLSSFQKINSTQTSSGSVFVERNEQVKKIKFKLELIRFVEYLQIVMVLILLI